ncbi:hypothetical protein [Magnetovibrio sp.]|uniref:hypothetical protein n=1 Tax=Magnetovibrio sp. TaxID=2024836 RepID=UPI002F91CD08
MTAQSKLSYFFKTAVLGLLTMTVLSACQTNSRAGKGDLTLSASTKQGLQSYMDKMYPTIFAASTNGRGYSYFYCQSSKCRDTVSTYQNVLDNCEKRSNAPCRLLAISRRIVWQKDNGEAYTLDELKAHLPQDRINMDVATLGALALCKTGYDPKHRDWYLDTTAAPYVSEIQKRGMSKEFCANLITAKN